MPHAARHHTIAIRIALVAVALCALAGTASAASVYKCVDAEGRIAFQASACAAGQRGGEVALAPVPEVTPAVPESPASVAPRPRSPRTAATPRATVPKTALSFECRASDGTVFYRHSGCPKTIPSKLTPAPAPAPARGRSRKGASSAVGVTAVPLPRKEACAQINRVTASSRSGYRFDERPSTYDRNLGRDPCRRF